MTDPLTHGMDRAEICSNALAARRSKRSARLAANDGAANQFQSIDGRVEIIMVGGCVAIIDETDFALVKSYRWHLRQSTPKTPKYAAATIYTKDDNGAVKKGRVYMHRLILAPPLELLVDHINGNGLDNRRSNLRAASKAQNHANRRGPRTDSTTGEIGVHKNRRGTFVAYANTGGRTYWGKTCKTLEEAVLARKALAEKHQGEYATHLGAMKDAP